MEGINITVTSKDEGMMELIVIVLKETHEVHSIDKQVQPDTSIEYTMFLNPGGYIELGKLIAVYGISPFSYATVKQ